MTNRLSLSHRLSVALSPLLQQSLVLLQTPCLELNALIDRQLEQNPVLEVDEDGADFADSEGRSQAASEQSREDLTGDVPSGAEEDLPSETSATDNFAEELSRLVEQDDSGWSAGHLPARLSTEDQERRQFVFDSLTAKQSFEEYLQEQVRDSNLRPDLYGAADLLIGNIGEDGFLLETVENLAACSGIAESDLLTALTVIQTFEPAGIGARDLRECLLLQLARAGQADSFEYRIVRDFMDELGKRRLSEIARKTETYVDEVQDAVDNIAKLKPRPGREVVREEPHYVTPEVFVEREGRGFTVTATNDYIRPLRISSTYRKLMRTGDCSAEVLQYIREKVREAQELMKSLRHRHRTLQRVAQEIVNRQMAFMERGPEYIKPLKMAAVAEAVGVHETTISRTVSGKFIQTPHGVFELRSFFGMSISTEAGEVSSKTIQERVVSLVKGEDPARPLTDEQIVELLKAEGIQLARRTVAKYRGARRILPARLRKNWF